MSLDTLLPSIVITKEIEWRRQDPSPSENPPRLGLMTITFLRALEDLGSMGRRLARTAGARYGRQLSHQPAQTVDDALASLRQVGIDYQVEGPCVVACFAAFRDSGLEPSAVVSCLQAGVIQGMLDGAGLPYSVRRIGVCDSWQFRYRICRRRLG